MTIKPILRDGMIQPVEPLPAGWVDGQELLVEQPELAPTELERRDWRDGLEAAVTKVPQDEHDRFSQALLDIERESKEAIRREWELR